MRQALLWTCPDLDGIPQSLVCPGKHDAATIMFHNRDGVFLFICAFSLTPATIKMTSEGNWQHRFSVECVRVKGEESFKK